MVLKVRFKIIFILIFILLISGCSNKVSKNDVYYEIFIGSFADSNQDGVGDINGIIDKLPYLDDLGVKGIWLMPINTSDSYHKYDVIDYYQIDKQYGSNEDFKNLIKSAKNKDIDIIIDLVINHTSSKHPWFIKAKQAKLNNKCQEVKECSYYNFVDKFENGYAKISNDIYYEARFYEGMPDLNLHNPEVIAEIKNIIKYYLDLGVSGFRLDAVYHYFNGNISENNKLLKELNDYVKSINENSFIVGEVWNSPNVVIDHYRSGVDSFFDFESSDSTGKIATYIRTSSGDLLSNYLVKKHQSIKNINEKAINSIFLSNHDQGRSSGYFFNDDVRKVAASIYLLSPDKPFIYYGEELGMKGSGRDENKRLAFKWNDKYQAKSPLNADYVKDDSLDFISQDKDKSSLLNHYRNLVNIRNKYHIFTDSVVTSYEFKNKELTGISFKNNDDEILIVHNLSDKIIKEEIENYYIVEKINNTASSLKNGELEIQPYSSIVLSRSNK